MGTCIRARQWEKIVQQRWLTGSGIRLLQSSESIGSIAERSIFSSGLNKKWNSYPHVVIGGSLRKYIHREICQTNISRQCEGHASVAAQYFHFACFILRISYTRDPNKYTVPQNFGSWIWHLASMMYFRQLNSNPQKICLPFILWVLAPNFVEQCYELLSV